MTLFKDMKYEEFVAMMNRSDYEQIIRKEHHHILNEKVEGSFEASDNNRGFNRFRDAKCFDHSRVKLPTERNRGNYINANYVDGFEYPKQYILSEAPTKRTSYDFYRMLWMEHARIIVMLCQKTEDRIEKSYPYWSDIELSSISFKKKFRVTTMKVERFPHYVKSTLLLTDGTDARQVVTHFNYISWPDHGIPSDTLEFLNFVMDVRRCRESLQGEQRLSQPPPMIVHCNAGLGRTPCFCAVDICMSKYDSEQKVSIASTVSYIRQHRFNSLFHASQYIFVYKVIKLYVDSVTPEKKTSPIQKAVSFFRHLVK